MASKRGSALIPIASIAILAFAGVGLAVTLQRREEETEATAATPGVPPPPKPDAPPSPAPAEPAADAVPPKAAWSKASLSLAGQADPYNPQLEELTIYMNQHRKLDPNSSAGVLYNGIRGLINSVPIVGSIVNVGMSLFEFVGSFITSSGGWRDISILARQRAVLYWLTPDFYSKQRPYRSQQIDMTAPLEKPRRSVGFGVSLPEEEYARQYRAWLRRLLMTRAYEAEMFRVTRTVDEVMLPAVVMELLYQEGAWPPPIEPMALRLTDYKARFANSQNPAAYFSFDDSVIELDNPLTRETYDQLVYEYREDALRFANRIARIEMPGELQWLAENAGCVPRRGSSANPKIVESRRANY